MKKDKNPVLIKQTLLEKIVNLTAYIKKELVDIHQTIRQFELAANKVSKEIEACQDEFIKLNQKDLFKAVTKDSEDIQIDEKLFEESEILDFIRFRFGAKVALGIINDFGGSRIYIPKGLLTKNNHYRIRAGFRDGATYKELAEKYGYTESYIREIVHRKDKWKKKDIIQK